MLQPAPYLRMASPDLRSNTYLHILMQNYYKAVALIGQGTYGNVYKCKVQLGHGQWMKEDNIVAVKKFKKPGVGVEKNEKNQQSKCRRELAMLKHFSADNPHPNIATMLDSFCTQGGKLCIVFEYIEKNLLQVIERHPGGIKERDVKRIIWQVLVGLKQLHDKNIMHRDVKPENILISKNDVVKLCDLGFARDEASDDSEDMTQYVSTRWYRAPELLLRRPQYDKSIDVWSIGCLAIELITGNPAFPGNNDIGVLSMIMESCDMTADQWSGCRRSKGIILKAKRYVDKNRNLPWVHKWISGIPMETRSFISQCLETDPSKRANVDQLLSHEWLTRDQSEWLTINFQNQLNDSILRTKSMHAIVMACKRLRMATSADRGQTKQYQNHRRQSLKESMLRSSLQTPKSSLMSLEAGSRIKHSYYTPQIQAACGYDQHEHLLDTPGIPGQHYIKAHGMMSPAANQNHLQSHLGANQEDSSRLPTVAQEEAADPSFDQDPVSPTSTQSDTLTSKLGTILHKLFK